MVVAVKKWMKTVEKLVVLACAAFAASSLFLLCSLCFRFWEAVAGGALVGGDSSQGWGVQEVLKGEEARGGGADGCDLFDGKWVQDESYPLYESKNCAFIDEGFRCTENGRPDRLYTQWRWQPARCNLPRSSLSTVKNDLVWVEEKPTNGWPSQHPSVDMMNSI